MEELRLGLNYFDFKVAGNHTDNVTVTCSPQDVMASFAQAVTFELGQGKANTLSYIIKLTQLQSVISAGGSPCGAGIDDILIIEGQ
jgi:hypothetical protein